MSIHYRPTVLIPNGEISIWFCYFIIFFSHCHGIADGANLLQEHGALFIVHNLALHHLHAHIITQARYEMKIANAVHK